MSVGKPFLLFAENFWTKLRLVTGNFKTRSEASELRQLKLLIFHFAKICYQKFSDAAQRIYQQHNFKMLAC
ncbi:MAG: hypothetical protein C4550_00030 [Nitrospiraceae bacterium]|nr:MAG: hypothetical protein C4550_00030 [Nitrospiraceae bacterium]